MTGVGCGFAGCVATGFELAPDENDLPAVDGGVAGLLLLPMPDDDGLELDGFDEAPLLNDLDADDDDGRELLELLEDGRLEEPLENDRLELLPDEK